MKIKTDANLDNPVMLHYLLHSFCQIASNYCKLHTYSNKRNMQMQDVTNTSLIFSNFISNFSKKIGRVPNLTPACTFFYYAAFQFDLHTFLQKPAGHQSTVLIQLLFSCCIMSISYDVYCFESFQLGSSSKCRRGGKVIEIFKGRLPRIHQWRRVAILPLQIFTMDLKLPL